MMEIRLNRIVKEAEKCIAANPEWIERYAEYAQLLRNNHDKRSKAYRSFRMPGELFAYTSISEAKKVTEKSKVEVDIRYLGQSVATLKIGRDGQRTLSVKKQGETNGTNFAFGNIPDCPWDSPEAAKFREHFKFPRPRNDMGKKNEEHRIENLLLREFSKTKGADKQLKFIQPVKLGCCFFQMPTPLSGSRKEVKYCGSKSGGVDILARVKHGNRTRLCVMEVKDGNTKAESPEKVIGQAVIYAVFLLKLLRSKNGDKWWKLFGMRHPLPKSIVVDAAVVMPRISIDQVAFARKRIPIGEDRIELHYVSFAERDSKIVDVVSSLRKAP